MTRIILVSGKGGVGKTTVAAATAVGMAERGLRTLILSFDLAHSLRDSFGLGGFIKVDSSADVVPITPRLDMKEIDIAEQMELEWQPIYQHLAGFISIGGISKVLASELAMLPGMEDISSLLALDRYTKSNQYDVIVLDCPPTASTLRFIGMSSGLRWYASHRLARERKLANLLRPAAKLLHKESFYLPGDDFFAAFKQLGDRLEQVERMLRDAKVTSVRLVTNPEKMVLRETQRAYMYFCMYGMSLDQIVINRVFSPEEPYFGEAARAQEGVVEELRCSFGGVPMVTVPFLTEEVVGLERLQRFSEGLFHSNEPSQVSTASPIEVKQEQGGYRLEVIMPFAEKGDVNVTRQGDDLTLRVGTFKRHLSLPSLLSRYTKTRASFEDQKLVVHFHSL